MSNQNLYNFQKRLAAVQDRMYSAEELKKMMQDAEEKIKAKREFERTKKELEEEQRRLLNERREKQEVEEDERRERREKARIRRELRMGPETKKDPMLDRPMVKDPKRVEQERTRVEEYLKRQQSPSTPKSSPAPVSKTKEELRAEQLKLLEEAERETQQPEVEVSKPKTKEELRAEQLKLLEEAEIEATEPSKTRPLSVKEERDMVERYMQQQKGDEEEIEKLLKDPSLVEQTPEGGWKCMTEGHGDRPATVKLRHNEVLGEGMPMLAFCKECAGKLKMTPIMENKPSKALLRRLSSLSNQLDSKGLFKEADFIDELINKLSSNAGWRQTLQQGGGEEYGETEEKPEKKRWPKKKAPEAPAKPKITCMTEGHRDRPAVMRLEHNKVLGDEIPDLAFCEECALRMRLIPIESKKQPLVRRFSSRDFNKIAADMSPQEYEKYYGKPMDKERLDLWQAKQQVTKPEPEEGIVDLFSGPDKEKLEERLRKSMRPQAPFAGSKKSLVSILSGLRSNASHFNMRLAGVWLNPNNVAVMLNAPDDIQRDSFLDAVEHYLGGTMANLPAQEFSHILSDGLVVVYDRTNKDALQTLKSYPGVDVVIVFMHWEKLDTRQQEELQEVIENLFAKRI